MEDRASGMRQKVGINSLAVDPMRPHLFITGSSDPVGETWSVHLPCGAAWRSADAQSKSVIPAWP